MEENQTKKKPIGIIAGIIGIAVLSIVLVVLMIVKGGTGASNSALIGKWEYATIPYVYQFNADGTGTYGMKDEDNKMTFTYKTSAKRDDDGNIVKDSNGKETPVIEFLYEGSESPMILEYRVEGDKLTVVDSFGNDVIYNRQK